MCAVVSVRIGPVVSVRIGPDTAKRLIVCAQ